MTSRQPGALPPGPPGHVGAPDDAGTAGAAGKPGDGRSAGEGSARDRQRNSGQLWLRLLPLVLLIVLGLAGLRGAVATPRWNGPLHRDGLAVGIALEVVFAILIVITLARIQSDSQQAVARKLRGMLGFALGTGAVVVAAATLIGLHLHLFNPRPRTVRVPAPPTATPSTPARPGSARSPVFHLPVAALLYTLLIVLLLAGVALSIWWARRLRPSAGLPEDAFIAEDSEDLREAVESGRSALRAVDDARAAIIACYLAMENSLAERGTARGIADTPDELLARARAGGIVHGTAAARLTALFYEARFSSHPLDRGQRDAAERALDELAADLAETAAAEAGAGPAGAGPAGAGPGGAGPAGAGPGGAGG
jgi:Domain of unknown function (DUF4129)